MTLTIRPVQKISKQAWEQYVKEHNGAFYQTWKWGQLLREHYQYEGIFYAAYESPQTGKEKIRGIFPIYGQGFGRRRRWNSVPWADFGGPLGDRPEIEEKLLSQGLNHLPLVVIMDHELPGLRDRLKIPFLHFTLEVDRPFEAILKKVYHQKTRNMVYKAQRSGVTVKQVDLQEGLDAYYPLFYSTMMKLQVLPFEKKFFQTAARVLKEEARLFLADHEGQVVAGILAFEWNRTLWIWGNASDSKKLSLGANNAVYSAVIEYACNQSSIDHIDFGSTIAGTPHHFFKKRWGGEEKPLYQWSHPHSTASATSSKAQARVVSLLRNLPCSWVQPLAHLIYKYY